MLRTTSLATALGLALSATAAFAAAETYTLPEPTAQLKAPPDPSSATGFTAAQGNCTTCHSPDYLAMQPPKKGQAFWEAEVTKMVKVYRAPIEDADAKAIAAYLGATY